jgi:hypothetical protein
MQQDGRWVRDHRLRLRSRFVQLTGISIRRARFERRPQNEATFDRYPNDEHRAMDCNVATAQSPLVTGLISFANAIP